MDDEVKAEKQSGGVNLRGGVNVSGGQVDVGGDMVGRDQVTINQYGLPGPSVAALAPHQLPPPPRDFTGRKEELDELRAAIEKGGVTISGLQGLGGVGKTALALKLADELKPRHPDAQFYLDLKGVSKDPLSPKDAMTYVIRSCHPDVKPPENDAELAGLYQSVLQDKRAILLMDNAKDEAQVEPLIPPASCLLIVTSRQHFTLAGLEAKNLDVLSPVDARNLILSIAKRLSKEQKDYASELARLCGYLPLALRSVAKVLAARVDLNPVDYIRKLADARERLRLTAVDASLDLSYDLLGGELQRRFRALAVFPDTFDVEGAAAVWEVDSEASKSSLSDLSLFSLVEFNSATSRYRLHDLVRVFADSLLDSGGRSASHKLHAEHYRHVLERADQLYLQGNKSQKEGLALFDTEWTNIQAGQTWAAKHTGEDDEAAELCGTYADAGAYCLELRQHPREHIEWLEPALAAARRLKNHRLEGRHLGNIGLAYHWLGEYRRAIEYHEKRLRIARETGDQFGEGNALGNLGIAYSSLGEYRRAIEYHEKHLKIAQEIRDRRGEGQAQGNLGTAYHSLGQYRRAIEYQEQRLQIARETGDRRAEGTAQGNLGNAYSSLGEYRRALEYYEQALVIDQEIGDRRGEAQDSGNLGVAYKMLGEYRKAIEYYEQSLRIARAIGDKSGEGNADWNISLALKNLGKRSEAIALGEEALRIYGQIESPYAELVRKRLDEWRGEKAGRDS